MRPRGGIQASGQTEIADEVLLDPRGECGIAHADVHFVVHLERAVVEVGRSEHRKRAVDDHRLRMHHRRLILVELDAEVHQPLVVLAAGVLHRQGVGVIALDEDSNLHAASGGLAERPFRRFVDNEIRRADVERVPRGGNRQQIEVLQIVAAVVRGAAQDERRIVRSGRRRRFHRFDDRRDRPGGVDEVLVERPLHQSRERSGDADHRVAPVIRILRVPEPVIADARAARERHFPVDDENLAVRPIREVVERIPARLAEAADARAGAAQLLDVILRHARRPEGIDNEIHLHAAACGRHERRGELLRDRAFFVDVGLERDAALCLTDGVEHRREELVAVGEQRVRVAARRLHSEQRRDVPCEARVGGAVRAVDLQRLLVLRKSEDRGNDAEYDQN